MTDGAGRQRCRPRSSNSQGGETTHRATIGCVSKRPDSPNAGRNAYSTDLLARFERRLSDAERAVVAVAREWAVENGVPIYCVGGSVRDLLLDRPHLDLDLALDGDSGALALAIAAASSAAVTIHPQFGTAVITGDDWAVDLVRTRSESYTRPAALPDVAPGSIAEDLARRDFSVHAMALPLNGPRMGDLLDPFDGRVDLRDRTLRVLHADSFRDDPTRILRLARYAARLHFDIASETATLARRDAAFLAATSPARVTHELQRIFAESFPERSLLALRDWRALTSFSPHFRIGDTLADAFARLRGDGGSHPGTAEYLAAIGAPWDRTAIQGLVQSLELRADAIAALRELPGAMAMIRSLAAAEIDPASAVHRLETVSLAAVRGAGAALGGSAAHLVRTYLTQWRMIRPLLDGTNLIDLGVPAGPEVGKLLEHLRNARLRGELNGRDEEIAEVSGWLSSQSSSSRAGP
jgi:tRNA nucleotidyltransferase (CCA-adding enzyme)